jgi:hypothetical protein
LSLYASAGLLLILVTSLFYAVSFTGPIPGIRDPSASPNYQPPLPHSFCAILSELYRPIKVPVTATSYTDQLGKEFGSGGRNYWNTSLAKDLLVVDIDTRSPAGRDGVFDTTTKMDWERVKPSGAGLLTLAHLNHYIYCELFSVSFYHVLSFLSGPVPPPC